RCRRHKKGLERATLIPRMREFLRARTGGEGMGETPVIDLDHNATTKPLPEVLETMVGVMRDAYANPGSQHQLGRAARRVLEQSRETIAEILDAEPDEICFTSGGTESTNLA